MGKSPNSICRPVGRSDHWLGSCTLPFVCTPGSKEWCLVGACVVGWSRPKATVKELDALKTTMASNKQRCMASSSAKRKVSERIYDEDVDGGKRRRRFAMRHELWFSRERGVG